MRDWLSRGYTRLFNEIKLNPFYFLGILGLFGYFIYRQVDFLLRLKFPIIPDENTHYQLIELYQNRGLFQIYLENTPEVIHYTTLTRDPWLYYYTLGKLLNLNIFGISDFVFLRIINILISVVTIVVGYFIIKKFTKSKFFHIAFLAILTNIPMLSFLSIGISYDNLVNLFSAVSILLTLYLYKKDSFLLWYLFLVTHMLGLLTKNTFLPLTIIEFLILLYFKKELIRKFRWKKIRNLLISYRFNILIVGITLIPLFVLVSDIYLRNIIQYKSLKPNCDQVISKEICTYNDIYNRGERYRNADLPEERTDLYHYLYTWKDIMSDRTLGIYSHELLPKTQPLIAVYEISILLCALSLFKNYRKNSSQLNIMLLLATAYIFVLVLYQNFPTYLRTNNVGLAVQGRYIFPVIIPIIGSLLWGAFRITPWKWINRILLIALIGFMIYGDYIYFNLEVTSDFVY